MPRDLVSLLFEPTTLHRGLGMMFPEPWKEFKLWKSERRYCRKRSKHASETTRKSKPSWTVSVSSQSELLVSKMSKPKTL